MDNKCRDRAEKIIPKKVSKEHKTREIYWPTQ